MNNEVKNILSDELIQKIETSENNNANNPEAHWTLYIHVVSKEISKHEFDKYYVGITRQKPEVRWGGKGHGYFGQPFYNAISKYKWDNIKHIIISDKLTEKECCEYEKMTISFLKSATHKYGYNIQLGGKENYGGILSKQKTQIQLGTQFGKLTVLEQVGDYISKSGRHISQWKCQCACGNIRIYTSDALLRKNRKDCGCGRSDIVKESNHQKYLKLISFEFFDEYFIYHFYSNKAIFDLEDYDKIKNLTLAKSNGNYFYKKDYLKDEYKYIYQLFGYSEQPIFLNKIKYDFRKNNMKIKSKKQKKEIKQNNKNLPIIQYDLNMNLIKEYPSIAIASKETGINKCNISACIKNRQKTAGGFIWKYKDEDYNVCTKTRKIKLYTLNAEFCYLYDDIREASKNTGIEENVIYKALNKESHYGGGFLWCYEDEKITKSYLKTK